jgi:hypothetical protein
MNTPQQPSPAAIRDELQALVLNELLGLLRNKIKIRFFKKIGFLTGHQSFPKTSAKMSSHLSRFTLC